MKKYIFIIGVVLFAKSNSIGQTINLDNLIKIVSKPFSYSNVKYEVKNLGFVEIYPELGEESGQYGKGPLGNRKFIETIIYNEQMRSGGQPILAYTSTSPEVVETFKNQLSQYQYKISQENTNPTDGYIIYHIHLININQQVHIFWNTEKLSFGVFINNE